VIDVRVFTQEDHHELSPGVNQMVRVWIAQIRKVTEGDKMAGRHGNKGVVARILPVEDMPYLPDGTPVDIVLNPIGVPSRMNLGQVLETHLGLAAKNLNFLVSTPVFDGAKDINIEDGLARVLFMEQSGSLTGANGSSRLDLTKAKAWVAEKGWVAQKGYDAEDAFSDEHPGVAAKACLEIWMKENTDIPVKGLSYTALSDVARKVHYDQRVAPPVFGKTMLYDGRTGVAFDQPVTVGMIYMLKLIHLVEDKIHARSTGPYSLITQQPLGGKAQFGGQRFGEMEVWALEAYSAAYNLQEMLTVKSDDVVGRVKTYEAIVKGDDVSQPGVPESFHVLLKELQSLGLAVELLNEDEERITLLEDLSEEGAEYERPVETIEEEPLQRTGQSENE
ncbi:MAG: DNA-directed polymerase subunit beta, partial [Dehalococcoidia bacterium]|nr:DNA-directed polymerase subunit beta [Dehalococcoidia bacterium]